MIKLQNNTLSREALPAFLLGLQDESLLDLSWTDPALGVQDCAWLPEVDQSPALQQYERYGDETLTLTGNTVTVTRAVVPWTADEIAADRAAKQTAAWERIKVHRYYLSENGGYKVSIGGVDKWFHSDAKSKTQQLSLVLLGANASAVPPWKTMDGSKVVMSQTLAGQIFAAAVTQDGTLFAAAEAHRVAMEASNTPESYDFSSGWPTVFVE